MLVSFAVTNFRSIYERQEITFQATKYSGIAECVLDGAPLKSGILPLIAIYGANASGKTNILRALYHFHYFIKSSYTKFEPEDSLPTDPHFFHQDEPTVFEGTFVFDGQLFTISFSYGKDGILSEKLRQGRRSIYSRTERGIRPIAEFKEIRKNVRKNALFISTAAQANHPLLRKIHAWFSLWDTVTDDRRPEEEMAAQLIRKNTFVGFYRMMLAAINPEIVEVLPPKEEPDASATLDPIRRRMENRKAWSKIAFLHSSKDGSKTAMVMLPEESKGTQSYFALCTIIWHTLVEGGFLILDEADQSLHPTLLKAIINLFQSANTNPHKAQLILNTHETILLNPEVLRPDQVWFAEKLPYENSQYYCLADFDGIRSDTRAQRAYLEGRFGAVPFIEDHAETFRKLLGVEGRPKGRAKKNT